MMAIILGRLVTSRIASMNGSQNGVVLVTSMLHGSYRMLHFWIHLKLSAL